MLSQQTYGIHLIFIPTAQSGPLSATMQESLERLARETAADHDCTIKALHVCRDHMHVLILSTEPSTMEDFFPVFFEASQNTIRNHARSYKRFAWSEGVHVTLMPAWHVEMMASFVRDQDRYHEHRTLEQELEEIFQPTQIPSKETAEDDATG